MLENQINKKLKKYTSPSIKPGKGIAIDVEVEDTKLCPRYMAVAMEGRKVEASPSWLQNMLLAVGLQPINNIVDVTNYIAFDLGQPMRAFKKGLLAAGSD